MKKTKYFLIFALVVLILSSCQSTKKAKDDQEKVGNEAQEERYIYTIGYGKTQEDADIDAKEKMAELFLVDPTSSLFPIRGTEIVKQSGSDDNYTATARLDKKFTRQLYINSIYKMKAQINRLYSELSERDTNISLYDIWRVNEGIMLIKQFNGELTILNQFDSSYEGERKTIPVVQKFENLKHDLVKRITFYVRSSGQNDQLVFGEILVVLNDMGFVINAAHPRYDVLVNLKVTPYEERTSTNPHYRFDMNLTLYDNLARTNLLSSNYSGKVGAETEREALENLQNRLTELIDVDFRGLFDKTEF